MSSPWAKISIPEPVSLQEIMSEQVTRDLQDKGSKKYTELGNPELMGQQVDVQQSNIDEDLLARALVEDTGDLNSDALIAQMLQEQFDEESDVIKSTGSRSCDSSKVSLVFNNDHRIPQNIDGESDSEAEEEGSCDSPLVHLNVSKFRSLPSECLLEDGTRFNLQCSDKVFNSLKLHSKQQQNRRHKILNKKEEVFSNCDVDEFTKLQLSKIVNKRLLKSVDSIITEGKESVILHAESSPSYPHAILPKECVVKVFKRTVAEFKRREVHIGDNYPFKVKAGIAKMRQTIQLWAEKEAHNLRRLKKVGIPCPEVVDVRKHMVVMSFIGENGIPAPTLKDAKLKTDDLIKAYKQIQKMIESTFWSASLIHADLSENNILWHKGQCYFIDVSQSVEAYHPEALQLLMKDCENITKFFEQRNVPKVKTAYELFASVTGRKFNYKKHLNELHGDFTDREEWLDAQYATLAVNVRPGLKDMVVTSFIDENGIRPPTLKDAKLSAKDLTKAYKQIQKMMESTFWSASLIHADLSENNILWHEEKCYFIDVSQFVEAYHPEALQLLMKDCENITKFFEERNVPNIKTAYELFTNITGFQFKYKKHLQLEHLHADLRYREEWLDAQYATLAVNVRPRLKQAIINTEY